VYDNTSQEVLIQGSEYQAGAKLNSLLTLALEELPDVPLYYNLHDLAKLLKTIATPQDTFRSALVNAGESSSSAREPRAWACSKRWSRPSKAACSFISQDGSHAESS
jgi:tRNA G26 N,N-dimethylase Trm1